MATPISASSFSAVPHLPTFMLEGAEETNGDLLFSSDDRWLLAWGDSGHLQVWDVPNCRRVLVYNDGYVRGALFADDLGGILVAADGALLLFKHNGSEFTGRPLGVRLPGLSEPFGLDSDCAPVLLFASHRMIACCTVDWITTLDTATSQVLSHAPLPLPRHSCEQLLLDRHGDDVAVGIVTALRHGPVADYLYRSVSSTGALLSQLGVRWPAYRLIKARTQVRPGFAPGSNGMAFAIVQSSPGAMNTYALMPFEEGMYTTASERGKLIAGWTRNRLVVWAGGELTKILATQGEPGDVKLTDSGRFAVILYCDGVDSPNVTGILDLATGRQVGHSAGHVVGLAPFAFSKSNRFFASLVTDGTASYHPTGLPSGTVVLTQLPIDSTV